MDDAELIAAVAGGDDAALRELFGRHGNLAVLRNVAGTTGIGLLAAGVIGGALAWIGPMAYVVASEYALMARWTTPWVWPVRPPHDRGAAICAALVFTAGVAVAAARGARDQG